MWMKRCGIFLILQAPHVSTQAGLKKSILLDKLGRKGEGTFLPSWDMPAKHSA
jgi:hypothetical protein